MMASKLRTTMKVSERLGVGEGQGRLMRLKLISRVVPRPSSQGWGVETIFTVTTKTYQRRLNLFVACLIFMQF